jgi:HK97 family phage prohead protease
MVRPMPQPNDGMKAEAQRGLDWRSEFGRGGTEIGIARARDIVNDRDLSDETVRRMKAYFDRHEIDKEAEGFRPGEDGYPSNGRIAWALWGGDPGRSWANKHAKADAIDEAARNVIQPDQKAGADMSEREIRRGVPVEIREDEAGEIKVAGYAAVFGEETNIGGMFTESIQRGAFKAAIKRDDVVFLINHEGLPLARTRSGTLKLVEDERGLYMEAMLDQADPDVRSIVPKMKRGDLDKMSFAFRPVRQIWDDSKPIPRRVILEAQLFDVSIVTTPAYDGTEIALRSLQQFRDEQVKSQAARRMRMKAKISGVESRNEYLLPPVEQPEIVTGTENQINMQNAVENWNLGPEVASADPAANPEYWAKMADVWSVNEAEARRQLCANCAYFNNTPEMLKAMEDIPLTAFDADGGGRGWCEKLDFICHNLRVCQAWERKDFVADE